MGTVPCCHQGCPCRVLHVTLLAHSETTHPFSLRFISRAGVSGSWPLTSLPLSPSTLLANSMRSAHASGCRGWFRCMPGPTHALGCSGRQAWAQPPTLSCGWVPRGVRATTSSGSCTAAALMLQACRLLRRAGVASRVGPASVEDALRHSHPDASTGATASARLPCAALVLLHQPAMAAIGAGLAPTRADASAENQAVHRRD